MKKILGLKKCALCDISHGWNFFGKHSWNSRQGILDSVEWIHSDQQPDDLSVFTSYQLPCVVMRTGSDLRILLSKEELEAMKGDLTVFQDSLESKIQLSNDEN